MNKKNNIENEEIRKNSEDSKSDFDNEWHQKVLKEIQEEKAEQKKADEKKADKLTKALLENDNLYKYENLWKITPEEIKLWDFIEDLNRWEWFRDDIKEKLKSNLIDSISPDDIYREYYTSLKEMPFMAKILSINDFENKKILLNDTFKKNNEISQEYFNEEELNNLSNKLGEASIDYVLNSEELSGLAKKWNELQSPLRLYVADKIIKNLSTIFWITPPYVTNINFWTQDLTMWSKWIINLNLNNNMFNNFHDFLAVLVHEFTHCLQDNYKTPWWEEGIKKAKEFYCNWITWDSKLDNLGKQVHDSSLLEKEAYYVQAKIKEKCLKTEF